jgi:Short C-terminal domain
MTGMTGSVPYYGGRFTPAQAYAAAHPPRPQVPPPAAQPSARPSRDPSGDPVEALQHLLDAGVLTQEEFDELRERVEG